MIYFPDINYKDTWKEYKLPITFNTNYISSEILGDQKFIFSIMDNRWYTHYFVFDKYKWHKDSLVYEYPIEGMVKVSPQLWRY